MRARRIPVLTIAALTVAVLLVAAGHVDHAIRMTVQFSQRAYVRR
jgi:hypothetical protein